MPTKPQRPGPGRQSKLTHALGEQIAKLIGAGVTTEAACESAGIGRATFYDWQRRGRAALEDAATHARAESSASGAAEPTNAAILASVPASEMPFVVLVAEVEQALARAECGFTAIVAKAAKMDWRAASWWLEKRCPAYGNRETVRIERVPASMSNDELEAELRELGFVRAAPEPPPRE